MDPVSAVIIAGGVLFVVLLCLASLDRYTAAFKCCKQDTDLTSVVVV